MSTYQQTTGKSIQQEFEDFHEANPKVWEYFKKYTREFVKKRLAEFKGKGDYTNQAMKLRCSSKLIINRIRWEISTTSLALNTRTENQSKNSASDKAFEDFKINDAFTSRYTRLFDSEFPKWNHLFNKRNLRS